MASFAKNPKITYFGWKKKSKNREKKFFQDWPELPQSYQKSQKLEILGDFAPIRAHFRSFFEMAKITKLAKMTSKNGKIPNSAILRETHSPHKKSKIFKNGQNRLIWYQSSAHSP